MSKKVMIGFIFLSSFSMRAMLQPISENSQENALKKDLVVIATAMKNLRDHLTTGSNSYEIAAQIKDIYKKLDAINQNRAKVPNEFRKALEEHFDEVKSASQARAQYIQCLNLGDFETPERYVTSVASARANKRKIKRFCAHLYKKYDVFKDDCPV